MLKPGRFAALCLLRRSVRKFMSKRVKQSVGVVFDLDGVIYKNSPDGPVVIPGTCCLDDKTCLMTALNHGEYSLYYAGIPNAIKRLNDAKIPYAFMTNGTGYTEAEKAKTISALLRLPVNPDNVVTCTTPFRQFIQKYGKSRVLVVGGNETVRIAREYGFEDCVGLRDYVASRRQLVPHLRAPKLSGNSAGDSARPDGRKIRAIFVFSEPDDWQTAVQVMCDVLSSNGEPCEEFDGRPSQEQVVELFFSNPDFTYPASHSGDH